MSKIDKNCRQPVPPQHSPCGCPTTLRSPFLIPRLVRHPAHCLGCISLEPTTTFCSAGFLILAQFAHLSRQPTWSLTIITFWTPSRQSTPYIAISLPLLAEAPACEPPKKYIHIFGPYILGKFSSSCYKTTSVTLFSLPLFFFFSSSHPGLHLYIHSMDDTYLTPSLCDCWI